MADFINDIYWPLHDAPEVDFDMDGFLNLLLSRGVTAKWYVAVRCPCGEPDETEARPDCPVCADSIGWIYPLEQTVRLIATGLRRSNRTVQDAVAGYTTGEAIFTGRSEHCPAFEDRIVLTDSRITKTAILTRKSDPATVHVETLNYPIYAQTYVDTLGATKTLDVLYIRPQNKTTGLPMAPLVKGVGYTITAGGALDFTLGDALGTAPAKGAFFTVAYKTRPVYRVISFPHGLRDDHTRADISTSAHERLPVQFAGKLEWLIEGLA